MTQEEIQRVKNMKSASSKPSSQRRRVMSDIDKKSTAHCACLKVVYAPLFGPDSGTWRERWICDQCGTEFWKKKYMTKEESKEVKE